MASDVRARMAAGAAQMLAQRGLQGASFAEVLALVGAPRGSVYHHFPGGKSELVEAALELVERRTAEALEQTRGRSAREVTEVFLGLWSALLDHSRMTAGCAVVAVTVAADSTELLDHAAAVFRRWAEHLTGLLSDGGLPAEEAASFAMLLIASTEGAVVLSRAARDRAPFDSVAASLLRQADGLMSIHD